MLFDYSIALKQPKGWTPTLEFTLQRAYDAFRLFDCAEAA
jgi:hypothetical protein